MKTFLTYLKESPVEAPTKPAPTITPTTPTQPKKNPPSIDPFKHRPQHAPQPGPKAYVEAIDWGTSQDRIHPEIEKGMDARTSELSKTGYFKEKYKNAKTHREEDLAHERFTSLADSVKKHTPEIGSVHPKNIQKIMHNAMNIFHSVLSFESPYIGQLEELAIELVKKILDVPEGSLQFEAKIKHPKNSDFIKKDDNEDSGDVGELSHEEKSELNDHIGKRHIINSLIQGSAIHAARSFFLIKDKLDKINPELCNLYKKFMDFGDLGYFMFPQIAQAAQSGQDASGLVRVDLYSDPPKITAHAVNFPLLVHELSKGVMEYISAHGFSNNKKLNQHVIDQTDNISHEPMALKVGPAIWKKLNSLIIKNFSSIRHTVYAQIMRLDPKKFKELMYMVIHDDPKVEGMINKIGKDAQRILQNEEEDRRQQEFDKKYEN